MDGEEERASDGGLGGPGLGLADWVSWTTATAHGGLLTCTKGTGARLEFAKQSLIN